MFCLFSCTIAVGMKPHKFKHIKKCSMAYPQIKPRLEGFYFNKYILKSWHNNSAYPFKSDYSPYLRLPDSIIYS